MRRKKDLFKFDRVVVGKIVEEILLEHMKKNPGKFLKTLVQMGEKAAQLAQADEDAKKLLKLMKHGSLQDFAELPPVSGLALLTVCADLEEELRERAARLRVEQSRRAIETRHDKAGGSREKREKVRKLWQSGKFKKKEACAAAAAAELGISIETAKRALKGLPRPVA